MITMIHKTLKMLRIINGMAGKDCAIALGISKSYLSEIENGKKLPPLELLEKYTVIFDVRLSTLILFIEKLYNEQVIKELLSDHVKESQEIRTMDMIFRFMRFLENIEKDNPQCGGVIMEKAFNMREDEAV